MLKIFFLCALASIAVAEQSVAVADNTVGKSVTLLKFVYHNNSKAFERDMKKTFRQIDKEKNGVLPVSEFLRRANILESKDPRLTTERIHQLLTTVDQDGNGNITYPEFLASMTASFNEMVEVDAPICYEAKTVLDKCDRGGFPLFTNIKTTFRKVDSRAIYSQCVAGFHKASDFKTERCVLAAKSAGPNNCSAVKQCVDDHFNRSERESKEVDITTLQGPIVWSSFVYLFALYFLIYEGTLLSLGFVLSTTVAFFLPAFVISAFVFLLGVAMLQRWEHARIKVSDGVLIPYVNSYCREFTCFKTIEADP